MLRIVLGVYGVILLLAGILGSDAEKNKAAGLNINLFWALSRPLSEELKEAERPGQAER